MKRTKLVNEELIQKTLKTALSKVLLENGLRETDIHFEVESLEGLKYDYLVSYGLFGPIVIELKLMSNLEIQNKNKREGYRLKLKKYLAANTGHGICAVFQVYDEPNHRTAFESLIKECSDISGLDIISLR